MGKLIASEWVTLDGVFDADTMAQWFEPYNSDGRAAYIQETIQESDAFLIGRITYEMFAAYWPAQKNNESGIGDKVNSVAKFVVSSTLKKAEWNNSTIINENIVEEVTRLKQQTGQNILISGSAALVQSLIEADLIDEYRFLVHPIIMGSGKHFFKDGMRTGLKLIKTKTLDLGVMLHCYQPTKK
jgi:dihydrofolate reductase